MGKGKKKKINKAAKKLSGYQIPAAEKTVSKNPDRYHLNGRRSDLVGCIFLVLITVVVYWQVGHHEFLNFDDDLYVTDNRHVQSGISVESISWAFSFRDKERTYWHPLTWISHILDCQLYGLDPGMHHLTNLILHLLNVVLLFLVFRRLTGEIWKSAFISALFAVHPINVDSVAWLAERKNVLSTFFWMLTLLSYSFYAARPAVYRYLPILFFFVLGLLAKPMLVTLPFVLLLLDYWPLGRLRQPVVQCVSRLVAEKIPLFFVSAVSIYLSISSLAGYGGDVKSLEKVPIVLRISNALVSYLSYIGKMFWPENLAVLYPYPSEIAFWKVACSTLFLIFVSFLVVMVLRQRAYLAVGWFWFLGTIVPVSGVVQSGLWPAMADRWAYVPFIGLFIMIAWGVPEVLERWRYKKSALAIIGVSVILILSVLTFRQLRYWENDITLYEHALSVTENNPRIHNNLGTALGKRGKLDEAAGHFHEAFKLDPKYAEPYYNLGKVLEKQGRLSEAIGSYQRALQIDPKHAKAYNNIGHAFLKQGKLAEAYNSFCQALDIKPDYAIAQNNLGVVFLAQQKYTDATKHFSEAVRIDPSYTKAQKNLNLAIEKQKKISESLEH